MRRWQFRPEKEEEKLDLKEELSEDQGWHQGNQNISFPEEIPEAQKHRTGCDDLTVLAPDDVSNGDASNL